MCKTIKQIACDFAKWIMENQMSNKFYQWSEEKQYFIRIPMNDLFEVYKKEIEKLK